MRNVPVGHQPAAAILAAIAGTAGAAMIAAAIIGAEAASHRGAYTALAIDPDFGVDGFFMV